MCTGLIICQPNANFVPVSRNIELEKEAQEKAARQVKAKAKAMAIALQTINKFIIKKKVGAEDQIFGRRASDPLQLAV